MPPNNIDLETSHLTVKPDAQVQSAYEKSKQRAAGVFSNPFSFWWWLVILIVGWVWVFVQMQYDPDYSAAFRQIIKGFPVTVGISIFAYALALVIGLLMGVVRAYPPEAPDTMHSAWAELGLGLAAFFHYKTYIPGSTEGFLLRKRAYKILYLALYNSISVYVEFIRGIPGLVLLLVSAFIIVPIIDAPIEQFLTVTWLPLYNAIIAPILNLLLNYPINIPILDIFFHPYPPLTEIDWRGGDPSTGVLGLGMLYGAYLAEVFRAGIQFVPKGQVEAAKSLGMTGFQTMRYIVIPQAVRNVLPALGNDFIAMIKDTSLVTIMGTNDMTQEAKKWSGSVFTYLPTYAVLSMMYLSMTVTGSLIVQMVEKRLQGGHVAQSQAWLTRLKIWLFGR
jgi:polar amino acid transport system permease protein